MRYAAKLLEKGDSAPSRDIRAISVAWSASSWAQLAARLVDLCPGNFEELLEAMRKIVGAQEALAQFKRDYPMDVPQGFTHEELA